MDLDRDRPLLWGLELRYALTLRLWATRQQSVAQLVAAVERDGWRLDGRPSKAVSDALRWEVRRGRVVRLARGRYAAGTVTRQTRHRMRRRLADARTWASSATVVAPTQDATFL